MRNSALFANIFYLTVAETILRQVGLIHKQNYRERLIIGKLHVLIELILPLLHVLQRLRVHIITYNKASQRIAVIDLERYNTMLQSTLEMR